MVVFEMKATYRFAWVAAASYTVFSAAIMNIESKLGLAGATVAFVAVVSGALLYYAAKGED